MATITSGPFTIQTTGETGSAVAADGTIYLVGACSVDSWTPAPANGSNGAALNWRGNVSVAQPFDSRAYNYSAVGAATAPVAMVVNDVLILTASGAGNGNIATVPRPTYFPWILGRSRIDNAVAIYCVSALPASTAFRKNAIGNPASRLSFDESQINWNLLPSVISSSTTNGPSFAELTTVFSAFMFDPIDGWWSEQLSPTQQHPGYGEVMAAILSEALAKACDDSALATKQPLVKALIQYGIDQWGAFKDGRNHTANGAHMAGRKAAIIFAGHMLGDADMSDPDNAVGVGADKFQEYDGLIDVVGNSWWGPEESFCYNYEAWAKAYLATDPTTWTVGANQATASHAESYHKLIASQLGTAACMGAIDRLEEWSHQGAAVCIHQFYPMNQSWIDAQIMTEDGVSGVATRFDYINHQGSGWSPRGTAQGSYPYAVFKQALKSGYGPYSYATTVDVNKPLCYSNQRPNLTSILFEGLGGIQGIPGEDVVTEIWVGQPLSSATTVNGYVQWNSGAQPWATGLTNPNVYGWHSYTLTIPAIDPAIISGTTWCVQFVYSLGGIRQGSNALVFSLP